VLIGLGHDIQRVSEFDGLLALRQPGLFFTDLEARHFALQDRPIESLAATFSAKEALFKALPTVGAFFWTDIEVTHDDHGKPGYRLRGRLGQISFQSDWRICLSISHSGEYVSTVALIATGGSF
jgi:holo-[acyl-carrier protein] synthase